MCVVLGSTLLQCYLFRAITKCTLISSPEEIFIIILSGCTVPLLRGSPIACCQLPPCVSSLVIPKNPREQQILSIAHRQLRHHTSKKRKD